MALVRAVLLDVDGTLVDSNDAHAQSWVDALAQFRHPVSFERVRCLIGMGGDRLLVKAAGIDKQSALGRDIDRRKKELFARDHLPRLAAFPRARELLSRMRDTGLTLVVATSAGQDEVEALLDICGARELVHTQATSDDADSSKPAPDIVRAALERAGVAPGAALMLGDTPYDIEAAGRAGVRCVAVRSGGWGDRALAGAVSIYDDASDLLQRFESSPFAELATASRQPADPATEEARLA